MGSFKFLQTISGTTVNGATTPLTYTITSSRLSNDKLYSGYCAGISVTGLSGNWGVRLLSTVGNGIQTPVMGVTAVAAAGLKYMSPIGTTLGFLLPPDVIELQPTAASWTRSITANVFVVFSNGDD